MQSEVVLGFIVGVVVSYAFYVLEGRRDARRDTEVDRWMTERFASVSATVGHVNEVLRQLQIHVQLLPTSISEVDRRLAQFTRETGDFVQYVSELRERGVEVKETWTKDEAGKRKVLFVFPRQSGPRRVAEGALGSLGGFLAFVLGAVLLGGALDKAGPAQLPDGADRLPSR